MDNLILSKLKFLHRCQMLADNNRTRQKQIVEVNSIINNYKIIKIKKKEQ